MQHPLEKRMLVYENDFLFVSTATCIKHKVRPLVSGFVNQGLAIDEIKK